jgi:hypothetical protein
LEADLSDPAKPDPRIIPKVAVNISPAFQKALDRRGISVEDLLRHVAKDKYGLKE